MTNRDLEDLAAMHESESFGRREVLRLRARAMAPLAGPSVEANAVFESVEIDVEGAPCRSAPHWLRCVCTMREHFVGAVFEKKRPNDGEAHMLRYATQSPFFAKFLRLRVVEDPLVFGNGVNEDELSEAWSE